MASEAHRFEAAAGYAPLPVPISTTVERAYLRRAVAVSAAGRSVLSLPIYPQMTDDAVHRVCDAIEACASPEVKLLVGQVVFEWTAASLVATLLTKSREPLLAAVLRVNLKGMFLVGQAAAKQMVAQVKAGKPPGAIVNMSSVNARVAIPNQVPYCISKGGTDQLTKVMALSLAPYGIRVNAIGPGSIMTDILKDTTQPSKDFIFGSWTNIGRVAALKTGTTDNLKDVYSVGYVPTLVTGVWMGNSNGDRMSTVDFASATGPGQLWRDYMKEALADTPASDWPRPANVVNGTVVSAPGAYGGYGSGLAPSALSPFSMSEWFIKGTEPARVDDWFVAGCVGPDGSVKVSMKINDTRAPIPFQRYTEQWVRDAIAGKHTYGRYTWNLVGPDGCPTPSPSLTPVPTRTPVPTPTFPRTPTLPPFPTPTPKKT